MMLITRKETLASVALLVLAGVFLYLGFTEGRPSWTELTQAPVTTGVEPRDTAAERSEAGKPQAEAGRATNLPQPAANPLEGKRAEALKQKTGEEFFVEYRLERDRVRSQEIQMLREVINNPNSTPEAKNEAQQRLIRLTEYMDQEVQLEALLQAKGYPDAAVLIQPSTVNVIVRAPELKPEDLNRIGELVARTTGRKQEEVVIIPWP
ncbi:MAG: SpoIIIAH-like family protein [Clostridia bacterium]|jgi:stage III sporulation protein AH|nr:SpoIIIAH-like family protein [Clostridia bacterium]MDH7572657.1 SpoIIIAH-like family protein [Clostridia bacterium]